MHLSSLFFFFFFFLETLILYRGISAEIADAPACIVTA